jgi:hypothetical protein
MVGQALRSERVTRCDLAMNCCGVMVRSREQRARRETRGAGRNSPPALMERLQTCPKEWGPEAQFASPSANFISYP